ncbi:acetyltransferase [Kitasatospora sp. MMS16-BH015]|uniref:GNAT family N-acetyltransferase n=1 Tax=Kitasatospora sp. MMS16-BH015 TaxID=2018025 RepID=UPI000CA3D0A2|nr:GNAT family N-acetyltransferase [Kitasatospora sp. MMS16-BH015]AUG80110.1 acetyltransferase [Kitasatospora sp. MMS16-BH015]
MTLTVRDFRAADAEAAAETYEAGRRHLIKTPQGMLWLATRADPAQHRRVLLAELDGRVVGSARVTVHADSSVAGQGSAQVSVLPEARRSGAGRALLAEAERHLAAHGVTTVYSWVDDTEADQAFATAHGYRRGRPARFARLDLTAALRPVPAVAPGVELRTAASFAADPSPLYRLDVAGTEDEPGEIDAAGQAYEAWLEEIWHHPEQDHELTTVALVDGVPAAFSAVTTDGAGRYWSSFTTTGAAFRGRGLAKLAKTDSLHRARAAGCTEAYTSNDEGNAPMLAVNAWLGYQVCAREWKYSREL